MKNTKPLSRSGNRNAGFTLIEMLIALLLFTIISAAAFSLFSQHAPLFKQQQNLAGLNIALRNTVAQLELDVVNGGTGFYQGADIPSWPIGVVINNNVVAAGGDCRTGTPLVYGANCFDSFVSIIADSATIPVNPLASDSGSLPVTPGSCVSQTTDTSASTSIYVLPPNGVTATAYAASFGVGDQLLLLTSNGALYTTVTLTSISTPTINGSTYVLFTHGTETNANGTNSAADDPTGMSVNSADQTTSSFCAEDWVIRLTPIEYDVDVSDPSDPKLRRTMLVGGQTPASAGVTLAEQIIGFKVGASLVNGSTDIATYDFNAADFTSASAPDGYDYTLVRSVMISVIGRTTPQTDPTYKFRNTFDGGAYETQGISVVVNPRNMSM